MSSFAGTTFIATESTAGTLADDVLTPITLSDVTSGVDNTQAAEFYIAAVADIENIASDDCVGSDTLTITVTAP